MLTTHPTRRCQARQPTDQLELAILEETPYSRLARALQDRSAGMFDLHPGMTLADYQNRWLDLVAIGHEETATARAESARLHRLAEAGGTQRRRWQAEADQVDGFVTDAMHILADWFCAATEPLLAAFDERHPGDEWFGVILADHRASEAYGHLTLRAIMDEADDEESKPYIG